MRESGHVGKRAADFTDGAAKIMLNLSVPTRLTTRLVASANMKSKLVGKLELVPDEAFIQIDGPIERFELIQTVTPVEFWLCHDAYRQPLPGRTRTLAHERIYAVARTRTQGGQ